MLSDIATSAKCPPGAPSHAECFQITVTGTTSGLGVVKSGGWLDVEAPSGSRACGQPTGYLERIVTSKGTLTVRAHGPLLCAGVVGTVHRSYTVVRGTGEMRRLHGHGLIKLAVLANGAAETWTTPRG